MRLLWILLSVSFCLQLTLHEPIAVESTLPSPLEDIVFPIGLAPLELRKPTSNSSWSGSLQALTFRKTTKLVLEFEPLDLAGRLETLELIVTINGAAVSQSFHDDDYSFEAPTQLGMVVDTGVKKIDETIDIHILLKMQWSFLDAGVRILAAYLVSFEPQPKFGDGFQKVPLLIEWNSYQMGHIPPLSLYYTTTAFLGNASGSNRIQLNAYIEVNGAESPWLELFLANERLYQGTKENAWINTTMDSQDRNWADIPLIIEFHPHQTTDRHNQVTFHLELYAEFQDYIDPRDAERERLLGEMPRISEVMGGILTLNAIFLPLLYFRKRRLEERETRTSSLIMTDN
ncbi:MAG: hypothetical protein ACFFB3_12930 [Candidatus Hodarchaeota archaeon]